MQNSSNFKASSNSQIKPNLKIHSKLQSWLLAARPKTLSASLVPLLSTVGLVKALGYTLDWSVIICALMASLCIQIGTNLVNDAMDYKKGADTEKRIGPTRVTQQGIFSFKQVMMAATLIFLIAIAFGIPLVIKGGWPIVAIGLVSVLMGYSYTAGPFPLAYLGLGDLFVILFFGLIAVGGLFYLLTGEYTTAAFVLGLQIGLLSTVLIAINNLRDIHTDKEVNKKTLAVRMGVVYSKVWIIFLIFAPFILGYYWLSLQKYWLYILPTLSFPLGISLAKKVVKTDPSPIYNKYLAMSAAYGMLFSLGFLIAAFI